MQKIKQSCGVSLLFITENETKGISRSFIFNFDGTEESIKSNILAISKEFHEKEKYIGIEDIFHVTILDEIYGKSVYGKSYIEPLSKKKAYKAIMSNTKFKERINENINVPNIVSLLFYSKKQKLGVTCLILISSKNKKSFIKGDKSFMEEFKSNFFISKLINKRFDGLSPKKLKFIGFQDIYSFSNKTINGCINFLTLYKDNINEKELNSLLMNAENKQEAILECEEWLSLMEQSIR